MDADVISSDGLLQQRALIGLWGNSVSQNDAADPATEIEGSKPR